MPTYNQPIKLVEAFKQLEDSELRPDDEGADRRAALRKGLYY